MKPLTNQRHLLFLLFHAVFAVHIRALTKLRSRSTGPIRGWRSQQNFLHTQGSNPRPLVKGETLLSVQHKPEKL